VVGLPAANTLGATPVRCSRVSCLSVLGTQRTQQVMAAAAVVAAAAALSSKTWAMWRGGRRFVWPSRWHRFGGRARRPARARRPGSAGGLRTNAAAWVERAATFYVGEGLASVAVSRLPNGVLNYHNAGKIQRRVSLKTCAATHVGH
jgi:hypothetical protein